MHLHKVIDRLDILEDLEYICWNAIYVEFTKGGVATRIIQTVY